MFYHTSSCDKLYYQVDRKVLCWLCTIAYKRVLAKTRKKENSSAYSNSSESQLHSQSLKRKTDSSSLSSSSVHKSHHHRSSAAASHHHHNHHHRYVLFNHHRYVLVCNVLPCGILMCGWSYGLVVMFISIWFECIVVVVVVLIEYSAHNVDFVVLTCMLEAYNMCMISLCVIKTI